MDFNKWEHFVNDDSTRSFLSLEVTRTGLPEVLGIVCLSLLSVCMHHKIANLYLFHFGFVANSSWLLVRYRCTLLVTSIFLCR
jgi:hypothetical protein